MPVEADQFYAGALDSDFARSIFPMSRERLSPGTSSVDMVASAVRAVLHENYRCDACHAALPESYTCHAHLEHSS